MVSLVRVVHLMLFRHQSQEHCAYRVDAAAGKSPGAAPAQKAEGEVERKPLIALNPRWALLSLCARNSIAWINIVLTRRCCAHLDDGK